MLVVVVVVVLIGIYLMVLWFRGVMVFVFISLMGGYVLVMLFGNYGVEVVVVDFIVDVEVVVCFDLLLLVV